MELLDILVPILLFAVVTTIIVGLEVAVMLFTKKRGTSDRPIGPIWRFLNWHRLHRPGRCEPIEDDGRQRA